MPEWLAKYTEVRLGVVLWIFNKLTSLRRETKIRCELNSCTRLYLSELFDTIVYVDMRTLRGCEGCQSV